MAELLQPIEFGSDGAVAGAFPAMRFDIGDLPEHRRRDALISAIDECFYPCETHLSRRLTEDKLFFVDVGPVRAGRCRVDPMIVYRTPELIRRRVGDYIFVPLPFSERVVLRQRGREADVVPGRIGFAATADVYSYEQPQPFDMLTLRIDADHVRSRIPNVEDFTGIAFDAQDGAAAMFIDYARSFCMNADRLDRNTGLMAVRHLLDLFALAITGGQDGLATSESAVREAHRQRILRHIEARLGDPALSTQSVAQDLRLSDRYIQKLLAERGETLSGLIRDRRVAEAKRLLREGNGRNRSISTIAFQVGYSDPAYFSRVFREATGMSPREYRALD